MMQQLQKITWKQLFRLVIRNLKFNLFGRKKLLLAFEFAIVISEVAKEMKVELTPEIIKRSEKLLITECRQRSAEHFACNMNGYALAVFEVKDL